MEACQVCATGLTVIGPGAVVGGLVVVGVLGLGYLCYKCYQVYSTQQVLEKAISNNYSVDVRDSPLGNIRLDPSSGKPRNRGTRNLPTYEQSQAMRKRK